MQKRNRRRKKKKVLVIAITIMILLRNAYAYGCFWVVKVKYSSFFWSFHSFLKANSTVIACLNGCSWASVALWFTFRIAAKEQLMNTRELYHEIWLVLAATVAWSAITSRTLFAMLREIYNYYNYNSLILWNPSFLLLLLILPISTASKHSNCLLVCCQMLLLWIYWWYHKLGALTDESDNTITASKVVISRIQ